MILPRRHRCSGKSLGASSDRLHLTWRQTRNRIAKERDPISSQTPDSTRTKGAMVLQHHGASQSLPANCPVCVSGHCHHPLRVHRYAAQNMTQVGSFFGYPVAEMGLLLSALWDPVSAHG